MITITDRSNLSDWSLETGYDPEAEAITYPMRIFSGLKKSGIRAHLQLFNKDIEYNCHHLDVPGYRICLHTPGDVFRKDDLSIDVSLSEAVEITIKPKLITTSDGLRKYEVTQRQCFFTSERQLHFFKLYSEANCNMECFANYTLQMCECVRFSMPSKLIRDIMHSLIGLIQCPCFMQVTVNRFFIGSEQSSKCIIF